VNTLILQYILGEPEWAGVLGDSDLRGITPLFTSNMSSTPTVDLPSDTPAPKQRLRSDSGCSIRRSPCGKSEPEAHSTAVDLARCARPADTLDSRRHLAAARRLLRGQFSAGGGSQD
jgi:hypothetical protein